MSATKFCWACSALIVREATRCRVCGAGQPDLAGIDGARLGPHLVTLLDDADEAPRARLPEPIRVPRYDTSATGRPVFAEPDERAGGARRPAIDRIPAGLLALLLGGVGVHKFCLGQWGQGLAYLLFSWTFIPALIALVEAILFFTMSDDEFARRYATM